MRGSILSKSYEIFISRNLMYKYLIFYRVKKAHYHVLLAYLVQNLDLRSWNPLLPDTAKEGPILPNAIHQNLIRAV